MTHVAQKLLLVILGVALAFGGFPVSAQPKISPSREQTIQAQKAAAAQVRDLLLQRQYAKAEQKMTAIQKRWPDDIIGIAGMMFLYQLRNMENFDKRFNNQYLKWHDAGRDRAQQILDDPKADAWHLYMAGGAYAMSGYHYFREGRTLRALQDGLRGIHGLEEAFKRDPDWVDPLMGLGAYKYWRSVYTKRVRFLPFFADQRKEGIAELLQVIGRGTLSRQLASGALAWIYINEKQYIKALRLNTALLKKYPDNVIALTLQGHLMVQLKRYREAMSHYQRCLEIDPSVSNIYYYIAALEFDRIVTQYHPRHEPQRTVTEQESQEYNEKIIPQLKRFMAMDPPMRSKALGYDLWGEILYRQKDWRGARKMSREALRLDYSVYAAKERLGRLRGRK